MVKHFTDDNFQQDVIEASKEKPVLVDFFATWCGPCQMQAPIIDSLAEEIGDKAIIGKADTEQTQNSAGEYDVMSIPTLIIFKDGRPVKVFTGTQPKDILKQGIEEFI